MARKPRAPDSPTDLVVGTGMGINVCVYQNTVDDHIPVKRKHPAFMTSVKAALEITGDNGSGVYSGTNPKEYLAFVNPADISPNSGNPFVVFVDPDGDPQPAMASASYRRDFKNLKNRKKIWPTEGN